MNAIEFASFLMIVAALGIYFMLFLFAIFREMI